MNRRAPLPPGVNQDLPPQAMAVVVVQGHHVPGRGWYPTGVTIQTHPHIHAASNVAGLADVLAQVADNLRAGTFIGDVG
jgi:hypothetical protein